MALTDKLTAIADAIREKTGKADAMTLDQMATEIEGISAGGSTEEWIGDGNTHIWITLAEGRTSPMLGVCPNGTVTVDWGDGTTPDTLTGTSTSSVKWTPTHNYAKAGDYVITLTVDGEMGLSGKTDTDGCAYILRHIETADSRNTAYRNAVKRAELGDSITGIGAHAFRECEALSSVVIPDNVTRIGSNAFYYCRALSSVVIPDNVTHIEASAFYSCRALSSVVIPDGVTSISSSTFRYCRSMKFCDFTKHTAVPTLANTNAFGEIPSDCEIRVPAALYDEWIAATNWSTYASQIVAV